MTSGRQCSDQCGVRLLGVWCISHVWCTIVHIEYRLYGVWCTIVHIEYRLYGVYQAGAALMLIKQGQKCLFRGIFATSLAIVQRAVKWECDQCGHKLSADINLNNHETKRESIHVSKGLVSEILFDAGTLEHHWSGLAPCEIFLPLWKFSVKMHQKLYCTRELFYVENICGLLRWMPVCVSQHWGGGQAEESLY